MVETICTRETYGNGRLYQPGDKRVFTDKKSVLPSFKILREVDLEAEKKKKEKPFSQFTKEEYLKFAEKEKIDVPATVNTKDKLRDFLTVTLEARKKDQKEQGTGTAGNAQESKDEQDQPELGVL